MKTLVNPELIIKQPIKTQIVNKKSINIDIIKRIGIWVTAIILFIFCVKSIEKLPQKT